MFAPCFLTAVSDVTARMPMNVRGSGDGLRLDLEAAATADLGGYRAIAPGDAEHSELMKRIASRDDDARMPPPDSGAPLSEKEVATFRRWIDQGAKYDGHWAYERPERPPVPPSSNLLGLSSRSIISCSPPSKLANFSPANPRIR